MSTETPQLSVPREPSAYRPTIHFADRFADRYDDYRRHLDGEIIDGCITNGDAMVRHEEKVYLRETFDGVTYRLVVDPVDREVITGYPVSINTEHARQSGRWSPQQIEDILEYLRDYDGPESR